MSETVLHYLIVFFISMVPLIELRVAVPMAINVYHLPVLTSYVICVIGNMLPVPVIFFFARKVLEWGADKPVIGKFFTFCLEKGHKGGDFTLRCFCSLAFRCPELVPGRERWRRAFWTWISRRALSPSCWE